MAAKKPFRATLAVPCGPGNAICRARLRGKDRYGGCPAANHMYHWDCTTAACTKVKDRYRRTAGNFPCRRLNQRGRVQRTRYYVGMPANPEAIWKSAIHAFVTNRRTRRICRASGRTGSIPDYCRTVCSKVVAMSGD